MPVNNLECICTQVMVDLAGEKLVMYDTTGQFLIRSVWIIFRMIFVYHVYPQVLSYRTRSLVRVQFTITFFVYNLQVVQARCSNEAFVLLL
jgi:hypothetical protein